MSAAAAEIAYRPTWYIRVRDADGVELVHTRVYVPDVMTYATAVADVKKWYTTRIDAFPVEILSVDMVDEYHPTASRFDRTPVEIEGCEEPDHDVYVNIGKHSIRVPAAQVATVMSALAAEVLKAAEVMAAWPEPEPDDWGDDR